MRRSSFDQSAGVRVCIAIGAGGFLLALAVSALLVPELRVLHLLQSVIYVAVLLLTQRNSAWGFGAGVLIGSAWNYISLFVSHLFQAGAEQFWRCLHTGHLSQPVPFMVTVGGVAHFLLIGACLTGFLDLRPDKSTWGCFFGRGCLALAYFGLIIASAAPR